MAMFNSNIVTKRPPQVTNQGFGLYAPVGGLSIEDLDGSSMDGVVNSGPVIDPTTKSGWVQTGSLDISEPRDYTHGSLGRNSNQVVEDPNAALRARMRQMDSGSLDKLRSYAVNDNDSPWLNLAREKQSFEEINALDNAARTNAMAMAESQDSLRGGFTGGGAERLATFGATSDVMGQQALRQQGTQNRMALDMAERQHKLDTLSGVAERDMNVWAEAMKTEGAIKTAEAQAEAERKKKADSIDWSRPLDKYAENNLPDWLVKPLKQSGAHSGTPDYFKQFEK